MTVVDVDVDVDDDVDVGPPGPATTGAVTGRGGGSSRAGDAGRSDRRRYGRAGRRARVGALLGPALVAAVAYVDPGNVATNTQAGALYGYRLVWVLVVATASAGVVQYLSAKLGVVTGRSLPELLGGRMRRWPRRVFWLQAEIVAVATDLAEVVGGALALLLLFSVPLPVGGLIAGAVSLALLGVQNRRGHRPFERVVVGALAVIAIGFVAGLFVSPPSAAQTFGNLVPSFAGRGSVLLATSMLGATVMPHVVYLHSALTSERFGLVRPGPRRRQILAATRLDVGVAMILAGGVNVAMLLVAASSLRGLPAIRTIQAAHAELSAHLGAMIGVLFAVALLVSGIASASVGACAGSVVMAGLLHRRVPLLTRRLVTLAPAIVVLGLGADPTTVLVLSQAALSIGLPFVLVPLLRLSADRQLMGTDAAGRLMTFVGWTVTAGVVAVNGALLAFLI